MTYLVWGYYGFENLGDELMLETIVGKISRQDPSAAVYVRCFNAPRVRGIIPFHVERLLAVLPLLMIVPYLVRVLIMISRIDVLVIGGGTLFLDKGRHNPSMLILAIVARMARILGRKVVLIGAGIDSLELPVNRRYLRWVLEACEISCFRDTYSHDTARSIFPSSSVQRSADIIFDDDLRSRLREGASATPKRIVLACSDYFRTWRHRDQGPEDSSRLQERINTLITELAARYGDRYRISLVAFQKRFGEQDLEFLDSLKASVLLTHPQWTECIEVLYPLTESDIRNVFSTAACVIAMRYHALVISAIFGRPFLGIAVETKISELCRDFSMPSLSRDEFLDRGLGTEEVSSLMTRHIDQATLQRQGALAALNFQWLETL